MADIKIEKNTKIKQTNGKTSRQTDRKHTQIKKQTDKSESRQTQGGNRWTNRQKQRHESDKMTDRKIGYKLLCL